MVRKRTNAYGRKSLLRSKTSLIQHNKVNCINLFISVWGLVRPDRVSSSVLPLLRLNPATHFLIATLEGDSTTSAYYMSTWIHLGDTHFFCRFFVCSCLCFVHFWIFLTSLNYAFRINTEVLNSLFSFTRNGSVLTREIYSTIAIVSGRDIELIWSTALCMKFMEEIENWF